MNKHMVDIWSNQSALYFSALSFNRLSQPSEKLIQLVAKTYLRVFDICEFFNISLFDSNN